MGKDLHVDQGTVRNRIRNFKQNGLLNEFYLGVNPSIFGYKIAAVWFDVWPQSEKENLKTKISLMDKVLLVCDYLGPRLSTVFCYDTEEGLKRTVRFITRMANSERVVWQNKPFLSTGNMKLTASDWKIIESLQRGDPWQKPYGLVAKETGLSLKTVKKRIESLTEASAVYFLASINLNSFEGFVPADLNVLYVRPDVREKVNQRITQFLGEQLVFADLGDKEHGYYALSLASVASVRKIQNWVGRLDGARSASVEVLQDILSTSRFYKEQVRNRIEIPVRVSAN